MENKEKTIVYAVMRLMTKIEVDFCGEKIVAEISTILGVIPVFETKKEAIKYSENGKYEILEMKV